MFHVIDIFFVFCPDQTTRLADESELGWRFVSEYESNPLASDSEDEKRMNRAEARANKKLKAKRSKKNPEARATGHTGSR
ncbi:hypothetical protein DPMN_080556 [Dreissena polymorpha]|uniref:Uncharacterized protein n=1 Tax=Dreissena polymorpha TaxID=45954 RepID=A0A9D4BS01_DREPO|nr:hypothetical protein DPMN_080556 [Dreissena polymorpha]